jgi:filamentous hemagglutinin family protein
MASYLYTGPRPSRLTRQLTHSSLLLLWVLLAVSHAQITLDGSLGPGGPLTGLGYRIAAELGQIRGGNLFHSFGEFNVPTGGSATFSGPATITNILSRVTGGQPSAIDGLLRSEIQGANLFLLNPSGVLFGPNATLDVKGSFHVSTADFLRLADGAQFFANLGQESVLTMAAPATFFWATIRQLLPFGAARFRSLRGKRCRWWAGISKLWGTALSRRMPRLSTPQAAGSISRAWPPRGKSASVAWSWRRISRWIPLREGT